MADKYLTLCADHLCTHNSCSGVYGICALSALSVGARCGIARDYVNTCPNKAPIPNCIARGPGKIAVFYHGSAGSNKTTQDLERIFEGLTYSFGEPPTFTVDDAMSAIEQFKAVPKPEITPCSPSPFERNYLGTWHFEEEEDTK